MFGDAEETAEALLVAGGYEGVNSSIFYEASGLAVLGLVFVF